MAYFFNNFLQKIESNKFVALVLVLACFFVYANAQLNQFVWDDEEQVVNNTVIRDWNNIGMVFKSSTFYAGGAGLSGGFYRPLVTLSYFWNYAYWGLNPFGYHLMQLIFHIANAFLVFYLLKKILDRERFPSGNLAAFFTALIFAVHPANVESVAYVGSIGEVVYVFFSLLAMAFFVRSLSARNLKNRLFFAAFVFVFLALLAKESAIMALFLMLAYLLLFAKPSKILFFKFVAATAAAVGFYLFLRLRFAGMPAVPEHYAPIYYAPLWQRLLTIPYEVFSYLGIVFYPAELSISRHFVVVSAADPKFWAALLFLLAICGFLVFYLLKNRSRAILFFILWFVVTLAPVLNIIPLDMTMAERWLYFPIIGLLAAAVMAAFGVIQNIPAEKKKIAAIIFIVLIIALAVRTIIRNADWKSGLSLYGRDIALASIISPQGSFDLENNYGVELFRSQDFEEAGEHFRRSIALQPKWASSQNNLGAVLERGGDLEGALAQYRIAAGLNYYLAHENMAGILIKMKRYDEARQSLEQSLAKFPGNANLQFKLAYLYAADNAGNNDKDAKRKALYLVSLVLRVDPQNPPAQQLYYLLQSGQKIEI